MLYDRYDGHTHGAVTGDPANYTHPKIEAHKVGVPTKEYFYIATNGAGANATWRRASPHAGAHGHTNTNLSVSAYSAPASGGTPGAGDPRFTVDHTTGNITTKGDVNGVDIGDFKDDYDDHEHPTAGAMSTNPASSAQLFSWASDTWRYFQVEGGSFIEAKFTTVAHTHDMTCAAPS